MIRRQSVRLVLAALLMGVFFAPVSAFPQGQQGVYNGTYGGTARTSKQWTIPIVAYVEDQGDVMKLRVVAKGYTVPFSVEQTWNGATSVTIAPSLNISIVKGSGTATFSDSGGGKWIAVGSGKGAVFNVFKWEWVNGSAKGTAERLSPQIDTALGDAWIKDHPEIPPPSTNKAQLSTKNADVKKSTTLVAVESSANRIGGHQLPVSEIERFKILFVLLFFIAISALVSRILGKPWGTERTGEIEASRADVADIQPAEGGATR